ncbi:pyroglutamyl-peptidase I [Undibacterium sp. Ren11W]|uniref:pyroglutamyl-peptidase I n=1 Tax=Undibacterium sp. Ren11W TaxID=3413045 RepID=UPI003BF298F7
MKTILLTGFEPFGGEHNNPSWEAVRRLDGKHLHDGSRIVAALLPCAFGAALDTLAVKIRLVAPDVVVCVGQAGGRADLTIERVAINVDDAPMADNAGQQPIDAPIVANGPVGYFATLPIKAIVQALHAKGIPASVSQTAGTYVCNHVFYGLMHMASSRHAIQHAGFVHIPYLPEQAAAHRGAPSMSLAMMMDALMILLETTISVKHDSHVSGGSTH